MTTRAGLLSALAGALAFAVTMAVDFLPGAAGLGLALATIEQPTDGSVVRFTNGSDQPVDIYVNHGTTPVVTDLKALAKGPKFLVKGKDDTPYGTYTFSARPKGQPGGAVIAEASIAFSVGRSFAAVLHENASGGHQMSVYEDDFSPTGDTRMTVRNTSGHAQVSWRLTANSGNPAIPDDPRSGTLGNGQWQQAIDVVQNDYLFEVLVGGQVVAVHPDLELEHEKDVVVMIVGTPQPSADPVTLRRHVLEQEIQVPPGPSEADVVTAPAAPLWTADVNAPIQFSCPAVEVWQTNAASAPLTAVDPDGVITGFAIDPPASGIALAGVTPSPSIGGQAAATVTVAGTVPAGTYDVTIVANPNSLGHRAACTVPVTVRAITFDRLRSQVSAYRQSGDVQPAFADQLTAMLNQAEQEFAAGQTASGCETLKGVVTAVSDNKGTAISEPAADRMTLETNALRADLGCG